MRFRFADEALAEFIAAGAPPRRRQTSSIHELPLHGNVRRELRHPREIPRFVTKAETSELDQ